MHRITVLFCFFVCFFKQNLSLFATWLYFHLGYFTANDKCAGLFSLFMLTAYRQLSTHAAATVREHLHPAHENH